MDPLTLTAIGLGAGGSLLGGLLGNSSQKKALKAQKKALAAQTALVQQGRDYSTSLLGAASNYRPELAQLEALNGTSGAQAQQDAYGAFRNTPGYQFTVDQALSAANRSAASRGQALSGRTVADLAKLGSGLADQNYQNYYGNLMGLFGAKLGTAGQLSSAYTGANNSLADIAGNFGNAKANAAIGMGNTWTSTLQGIANSAGYGLGQMAAKNASSYGGGWSASGPASYGFTTPLYY